MVGSHRLKNNNKSKKRFKIHVRSPAQLPIIYNKASIAGLKLTINLSLKYWGSNNRKQDVLHWFTFKCAAVNSGVSSYPPNVLGRPIQSGHNWIQVNRLQTYYTFLSCLS